MCLYFISTEAYVVMCYFEAVFFYIQNHIGTIDFEEAAMNTILIKFPNTKIRSGFFSLVKRFREKYNIVSYQKNILTIY